MAIGIFTYYVLLVTYRQQPILNLFKRKTNQIIKFINDFHSYHDSNKLISSGETSENDDSLCGYDSDSGFITGGVAENENDMLGDRESVEGKNQ